jgi:hypothetical protein
MKKRLLRRLIKEIVMMREELKELRGMIEDSNTEEEDVVKLFDEPAPEKELLVEVPAIGEEHVVDLDALKDEYKKKIEDSIDEEEPPFKPPFEGPQW